MKSSLSLIYTVCRIFLYRSKIFPNFFTALYFLAMPHLLTKTAEQNSAGKQKKQARIFGARKHEVHIFHPAELSLPAPYTSPTSTSNPIISTFFFLFFIANILPAISTILPFFHFQSLTPTSSPPPSPTPPPPFCCRFSNPQAKRET